MRRIALWFTSTVVVVVLLFSYRTSTMGAAGASPVATDAGRAPQTGTNGGTGATLSAGGTGTVTGGDTAGDGKTVDGTVAQTRWGPVQVRVRIAGGKITDVTAVQVPDGNRRDQEINNRAVPQLRQQVLAAQSAQIDGVSGATVTSDGYRTSLQAALDAAHF